MLKAAFCGLPHSESEFYYAKVAAIGREPTVFAMNRTLVPANS